MAEHEKTLANTIGLYIHVPFCLKKCCYCDFVSYPYSEAAAGTYLDALLKEIDMYSLGLPDQEKQLASIFIGGGTPTCLSSGSLTAILDRLRRGFSLVPGCEITIEANPGTVDRQVLDVLRTSGVNRLSLGIQAFQDQLLSALGRVHTAAEAVEAIRAAREAGFDNLNLDFIFGIPGQTREEWLETISLAADLRPEHIAVYGLQLEERTPLERLVARGEIQPCSEELELSFYLAAIEFLSSQGYVHYEISNFARPGRESVHNLGYWLNRRYLGLGPAAHSYLPGGRYANDATLAGYAGRVARGELPVCSREGETVAKEMSETIFLGLRLIGGFDLAAFYQRFGRRAEEVYRKEITRLLEAGLVEFAGGRLRLTAAGLPLANEVFIEFV
ncbi:radical SAM family heme chaperone HemW [Pelotomaculum sp. PtaB.Bin117]|uniref:radical SAM family heme chaperone HemW n=1 Tax=Pelotomaculum sp. PtaB.Bin117 TaxID=1811694 RepID=UPI0009CA21F2|nr:radical SAM family heme chaperone HemW [Pelotomaculum sp. PtaB.Bin117]OPX87057.1 MAG: Oxygen-independent coproporphyrinogen-III oxidase 1 [Pelotomaculum sp. PtaB.Bin117]